MAPFSGEINSKWLQTEPGGRVRNQHILSLPPFPHSESRPYDSPQREVRQVLRMHQGEDSKVRLRLQNKSLTVALVLNERRLCRRSSHLNVTKLIHII